MGIDRVARVGCARITKGAIPMGKSILVAQFCHRVTNKCLGVPAALVEQYSSCFGEGHALLAPPAQNAASRNGNLWDDVIEGSSSKDVATVVRELNVVRTLTSWLEDAARHPAPSQRDELLDVAVLL